MSTGDPHFPGNCWCGINHSESDWQAGYDAAKKEVSDVALRGAAQAAALSDHAPMYRDGGVYRACGCHVHSALRAALGDESE